MGNKFNVISPSWGYISKLWIDTNKDLMNVFCLHPLERTASVKMAAIRLSAGEFDIVKRKIEGKLQEILNLPKFSERKQALMGLLSDKNALEVIQQVLYNGYLRVVDISKYSETIEEVAQEVLENYLMNIDDIAKTILRMGPISAEQPFKFLENHFTQMVKKAAQKYGVKKQRGFWRAIATEQEKDDLLQMKNEWKAEQISKGVDPVKAQQVADQKALDFMVEQGEENTARSFDKPSSLDYNTTEQQELGELDDTAGMTPLHSQQNNIPFDQLMVIKEELDAQLSKMAEKLAVDLQSNIPLDQLTYENEQSDALLGKYQRLGIDPDSGILRQLMEIKGSVEDYINSAQDQGAYTGDFDPDRMTDLVHSYVGSGAIPIQRTKERGKKKQDRSPKDISEFTDIYQGMRGQSRELIPHLSRLIHHHSDKIKGMPDVIPELNVGKSLGPIFYSYLENPDSPQGKMAEFILRKLLDTIDFTDIHGAYGIPMDEYVEQNPKAVGSLPPQAPEELGTDDDLEEDDVVQELPNGQPEAAQELAKRKKLKLGPDYLTGAMGDKSAMRFFSEQAQEELKSNPALASLGPEWQKQVMDVIGGLSESSFRDIRNELQIGLPLAVAEKIRSQEFDNRPWTSLSDEEIQQLAKRAMDSYYAAYPRRIKGYGEHKGLRNLLPLKQRGTEYKYLVDVLTSLRSKMSGEQLQRKTIFPDIRNYDTPEQQRAAVVNRLIRVANILDINNCANEASLIDEIVQEYARQYNEF